MTATYWGKANHTAQWFGSAYTGSVIVPRVVVLHSTEGSSWPGYDGGAVAPNLTAKWNGTSWDWRQHYPLDRSSRALRNRSGGVETNTAGAVQIEIVGTDGWATAANKNATYHTTPVLADLSDDAWGKFGADLAALCKLIGVPFRFPYAFTSWANASNRLTGAQWLAASGIVGHCHVPENDHTDPGLIPTAAILAGGGTTTKELTMADITTILAKLERLEDIVTENQSRGDHTTAIVTENQKRITSAKGTSERNQQILIANQQRIDKLAAQVATQSGGVDVEAVRAAVAAGVADALQSLTVTVSNDEKKAA